MKARTRNFARNALAAAAMLASASLLALPPGTRTPDMMVNLQATKNSEPCPIYGFAVNQQINADGSLSPFSIPEGYSLVITGYNWHNYVSPGVIRHEGRLSIQNTAATTIFADFRYDSGSYSQGGHVTGISDMVVGSGVVLCYGLPTWDTASSIRDMNVNVHGYLAKDKSSRSNGSDEEGAGRRSR